MREFTEFLVLTVVFWVPGLFILAQKIQAKRERWEFTGVTLAPWVKSGGFA